MKTSFVIRLSGLIIYLTVFFNSSLFAQQIKDVSKIYALSGDNIDLPTLWYSEPAIFLFYSVDCPLCRNYTKTINDLSKEFLGKVNFFMVFSGKHQKVNDINKYIEKYQVKVKILRDPKYHLSEALNANITPEAVLIKDGNILYYGGIDDWVIRLGNTKKNAKEHYLKDAIEKTLKGKKIAVKHNKAIGCYIK